MIFDITVQVCNKCLSCVVEQIALVCRMPYITRLCYSLPALLFAVLLVVLGLLHVPLLDIFPLSLEALLAQVVPMYVPVHTPLFMASQIFSEPVSNALSFYISILSIFYPHRIGEPRTVGDQRPRRKR